MLQKLALLWMLEDQDGKLNRPEKKENKGKRKKDPPQVQKVGSPTRSSWSKALCPLLLGSGSVVAVAIWL